MSTWSIGSKLAVLSVGLLCLGLGVSGAGAQATPPGGDIVALGKALYFDEGLSATGTQACASCHDPATGFVGPDSTVNAGPAIYEGAIPGRFGDRRPPTAAYAGDSPLLHFDADKGKWVGGMFWDGRATGAVLGDPLAEQAQGPFLNALEHALPNARVLAVKVSTSEYAGLFEEVWGPGSLNVTNDVEGTYERIARSIAAYERSDEVNPYSSKFDLFWDNAVAAGKDVTKIKWSGGMRDPNSWQAFRGYGLNDEELRGLATFNDPMRADCASCHSLKPGPEGRPLFTDFSYDNLGIPKNPDNPFYAMPPNFNPDGEDWIDEGLGGYLESAGYAPAVYEPEMGKFKAPTLRNVDLRPSPDFVKSYGHNGYFKTLWDIVFFYHWRAAMDSGMGGGGMGGGMGDGGMGGDMGNCPTGGNMAEMFPAPELDQNRAALPFFPCGDVDRIVTFLTTLSDGYYER